MAIINVTPDMDITKFLVDREGNVVKRFEPADDFTKIEESIKELL